MQLGLGHERLGKVDARRVTDRASGQPPPPAIGAGRPGATLGIHRLFQSFQLGRGRTFLQGGFGRQDQFPGLLLVVLVHDHPGQIGMKPGAAGQTDQQIAGLEVGSVQVGVRHIGHDPLIGQQVFEHVGLLAVGGDVDHAMAVFHGSFCRG